MLPLAAGCGSTSTGGDTSTSAITPKSDPPGPPSFTSSGRAIALKGDASTQSTVNNVQVSLVNGWNGVGFQAQQITSLTPGAGVAGLASYSNGSYTPGNFDASVINQGDKARRGFWVFSNGAGNFTYSGVDDGQGNFVNLQQGYNLVSFTTNVDIPGNTLTAQQNGSNVTLSSVVLPLFYEIQPGTNAYNPVDVTAGGTLKPGRAYWVFSTGNVRLNWPGGASGFVVTPSGTVNTVVGAQITFSAAVNGTPTNVTVASGNPAVAQVSGNALLGVSTGTTNYTVTGPGGAVSSGTINVLNGSLSGTLVISPGTALSVSEGEQRQFQAFAQFATASNGTIQSDVTNQCVWIVTVPDAQNRGEVVNFDANAGQFTATRGNAGVVQVGAIYSTTAAVATGNTAVTINRSNPAVQVRPVGSTETTGARVPGGGWNRLFEAVAVYPSGYQRVLTGTDVAWTNTSTPTVSALNAFAGTGRAELVTSTVPGVGQLTLTATYTNSASGLAGGNHTVGIISSQLQNTAAAFSPSLPNDLRVIPGKASTTQGFIRPVTVTATFTDRNAAGNNLVMPLFTNPAANSAARAGAISLYLNPGAFPGGTAAFNGNIAALRTGTDATLQLLTGAITPVGYTHLLRNVTTGLYNQNVLNIRVNYRSAPTLQAAGPLNVSTVGSAEVAGASTAIGGDRDVARTATITNMTVDGNTAFSSQVQNANLRRGQGTNVTVRAQYAGVGGATEDVTILSDLLISSGAANARVSNTTNSVGEVKGRVYNLAPVGGGTGQFVVGARYPHVTPGGDTTNTTVNITLP